MFANKLNEIKTRSSSRTSTPADRKRQKRHAPHNNVKKKKNTNNRNEHKQTRIFVSIIAHVFAIYVIFIRKTKIKFVKRQF